MSGDPQDQHLQQTVVRTATIDISDDAAGFIERRRRQMYFWVILVSLLGLSAFGALIVVAKHRTVYSEHYEFRAFVKPGVTEEDVRSRFGRPYRTYWTKDAIAGVLSGRGVFTSFDRDVSSPDALPAEYEKVIHYRPTPSHGEFVFIGSDGRVLLVVTGRSGDD